MIHLRKAGNLIALCAVLLAPTMTVWARGTDITDATRAEYQITDQRGTRALSVIRSADRIEYREGDTIRVWRKLDDGVEQIEVFPKDQRTVVYSPGDLETVHRTPHWDTLTSLVGGEDRARLAAAGNGKRFEDHTAQRLKGNDSEGRKVELEWLADSMLPARYSVAGAESLRLQSLQTEPANQAFTDLSEYRAYDYADLGDSMDPFALNYLKISGSGHSHGD